MDIIYTTTNYFVTKDYDGVVWYQIWETGASDWFDTASSLQEAIDEVLELEHFMCNKKVMA